MAGGFKNYLTTKLGQLVIAAIQSPNFVHGLAGWSINKDGSAEFQDVILPASTKGATVTFAATAPASPNVGDLWYDTGNGLKVSQWNGSAWVPYQVGTGAVASGAITTALLAANAVTAAKLAAGIVYAGIVDSTTVNAATFTGSVFEGTDFIINSSGAFFYSGPPAAGNLIASIATAAGTDSKGNPYSAGINVYGTSEGLLGMEFFGSGNPAGFRMVPNNAPSSIFSAPGLASFSNGTGTAQYTAAALESGEMTSGSGVAEVVAYGGSTDGTTSIPHVSVFGGPSSSLLADFSENGLTLSPATQSWRAAGSKTDTTAITMGNVISPDQITVPYTIDSSLAAGIVYEIATEFSGTWGNQLLSFYADINGTFTVPLAVIGAAFGSAGDAFNGWIRLIVRITSATACHVHVQGGMANTTLNSGHLLNGSNTLDITSAPTSGTVIAAGDNISIAAAWGASATQSLETFGSTCTRSGNP